MKIWKKVLVKGGMIAFIYCAKFMEMKDFCPSKLQKLFSNNSFLKLLGESE